MVAVAEVSGAGKTLKRGHGTGTLEVEAADETTVMEWCLTRMTTIHRDETVEQGAGQHPQSIERTGGIVGVGIAAGDTSVTTGEVEGGRGAERGRRIGGMVVDNDLLDARMAMLGIRFA